MIGITTKLSEIMRLYSWLRHCRWLKVRRNRSRFVRRRQTRRKQKQAQRAAAGRR